LILVLTDRKHELKLPHEAAEVMPDTVKDILGVAHAPSISFDHAITLEHG
jgi:hypothetical protein